MTCVGPMCQIAHHAGVNSGESAAGSRNTLTANEDVGLPSSSLASFILTRYQQQSLLPLFTAHVNNVSANLLGGS